VPIQHVKIGDRVLSQDLDSGELAYKTVLRTTALPPTTETVRVMVDGESIDMTKAHVLWVTNKGWRMAKELEPGDRLHGVHGVVTLEATVELPPELEVYNLVVADFNTFFVGQSAALVHDITYVTRRRPTMAIVPGLLPRTPQENDVSLVSTTVPRSIPRQVYEGLRQ
jgi:hypothetical protein